MALQNSARETRGVPTLGGARDKKYVWRPLEANVLYWRKYLRHCWDFSATS